MPLRVVLPPLCVRWRRAALLAIAALVASTSLVGCSVLAPKPPGAPAPPAIQTPPGGAEAPPPPIEVQPAAAPPVVSHVAAAPVHPPVKHKRIRHRPKRKYKHHAAPEPIAPPPPPSPTPLIETRQLSPDQAEELLETEIQKPAGKVIGRVVDVLVDANARPQDIVVNLTGFLGVGDRQIKFPWSVFRFNPTAKKPLITLLATPAEVAAANAPKAAKYGAAGVARPAGAAPPLTASLSDATIVRHDGSTVGHVVDVLVDGAAQPQALVLDVGASINDETPNIAASWSALHLVEKDKALQLQMELSAAQIKASPPYTSGKPILVVSPAVPVAPATGVAATVVPPHAAEPVPSAMPAATHAAAPAAASAPSTPARAPAAASSAPAHATAPAPTSAPAHASAPTSAPEPVRASGSASTPPVAHAPPATATATPTHPSAAASSPMISR
jgi:sporulation protein YlmC with PRC-barrel domain